MWIYNRLNGWCQYPIHPALVRVFISFANSTLLNTLIKRAINFLLSFYPWNGIQIGTQCSSSKNCRSHPSRGGNCPLVYIHIQEIEHSPLAFIWMSLKVSINFIPLLAHHTPDQLGVLNMFDSSAFIHRNFAPLHSYLSIC